MRRHLFKQVLHHDIMFDKKAQEGATMLVVLLVLTVMIAIGFVLTSIVYREISLARTYGDSLQAFYAAESGIEQGLDVFGVFRTANKALHTDDSNNPLNISAVSTIQSMAPNTAPLVLADAQASYTTTANYTVDSVTFPLVLNSVKQIDLYDPDQFTQAMHADSVKLLWKESSSCFIPSIIEVTLQSLDQDALNKQILPCTTLSNSLYTCEAISNVPTNDNSYILRIRALNCDLDQMNVTFYQQSNALGTIAHIPSMAIVTSIGKKKTSERRMTATAKWMPSASGLSDFVLFSIENINKAGIDW